MPHLTPLQAFSFGVLHAIGRFDPSELAGDEALDTGGERGWFALGGTVMAGLAAASIAVPAASAFAGRSGPAGALTAAVLLFLPLFVFLPGLLRYAAKADTEAVIAAFGRNEQTKKVFWTLFLALAGLVLAQVADPALAEKISAALAAAVP